MGIEGVSHVMRVVVLGAGYAGLATARRLERSLPAAADLVVVNDSPDHLVQHELHRVLRKPALANDLSVSLPRVLSRASVEVDRVESVDRENRTVSLSSGTLSYDVGVLALGAATAYYDIAAAREHGIELKRLRDAHRIRARTRELLTRDEARIVVVGAGLSGIQVAGELAAFGRDRGREDAVSVTLCEQLDTVAPGFSEPFQDAVANALDSQGVAVRTDATVVDADEETVELSDGSIESDLLVWTAGICGQDALDGVRPTVGSNLRLDDRLFACGDAATVVDEAGEPIPASAQAALGQAKTVAKNVTRVVEALEAGDSADEPRLDHYSFDSPGWLVSVGDETVAQVGGKAVTGTAARAMKATVGLRYLSAVGEYGRGTHLATEEVGLGGVLGGNRD